jgi:hypothetical protein
MPAPIALTDEEMDAVMRAATPIDPAQRGAFLRDIAIELAKCPEELGPGSVYRATSVDQCEDWYYNEKSNHEGRSWLTTRCFRSVGVRVMIRPPLAVSWERFFMKVGLFVTSQQQLATNMVAASDRCFKLNKDHSEVQRVGQFGSWTCAESVQSIKDESAANDAK